MDTEYLRTHLGQCLVECLAEVSEKRPLDPIEYMAHWLHKHIDNIKYQQMEAEKAAALEKEREEYEEQQRMMELMQEEEKRLAEEEEAKRKEAEAAAAAEAAEKQDKEQLGAPGLPTVQESVEPDSARAAEGQEPQVHPDDSEEKKEEGSEELGDGEASEEKSNEETGDATDSATAEDHDKEEVDNSKPEEEANPSTEAGEEQSAE